MPQNPQDTTNPGLVNVANQGDGPLSVDQPVTTGPGTNPGPLVPAADEGFGIGDADPDQPVTTGPGTNPGPLVKASDEGFGLGDAFPDQPVTVGPSQSSASADIAVNFPGEIVEPGVTNAGTFSPVSPDTINVIQNNVVEQIYGQGSPQNVFV